METPFTKTIKTVLAMCMGGITASIPINLESYSSKVDEMNALRTQSISTSRDVTGDGLADVVFDDGRVYVAIPNQDGAIQYVKTTQFRSDDGNTIYIADKKYGGRVFGKNGEHLEGFWINGWSQNDYAITPSNTIAPNGLSQERNAQIEREIKRRRAIRVQTPK